MPIPIYRPYVFLRCKKCGRKTDHVLVGMSNVRKGETEEDYECQDCGEIEPIVIGGLVSSSATEPQTKLIVREEQVSSGTEPQPRCVSGLVKCAHCGKTYSQPLRRLDFSADKPRIINVCPTCNKEIKLVNRRGELERVEKAVQKKKDRISIPNPNPCVSVH